MIGLVADFNSSLIPYASARSAQSLNIKVSFFVYLVGLMSAIGWILFFGFGGVGIVAMPFDFVNMFRDRPIPITASEYAAKKVEISKETEKLMEQGKKLDEEGRGGGGRRHARKVLAFKNQVVELEALYEKIEISYREGGGRILKAIAALIIGIISAFLSVAWILHIIIWNIGKFTPFLNNLFIALNNALTLLGVLAYGIFSFYLLWCVVKGCTKVGLTFFIFKVYPMKVNDTLMNAFLFNSILLMLTSVTVVQFCTMSFSEYAVNTGVSTLFLTYVMRLKGVNYVVQYLQYPLLAVAFLTLLYMVICRRKKKDDDEK